MTTSARGTQLFDLRRLRLTTQMDKTNTGKTQLGHCGALSTTTPVRKVKLSQCCHRPELSAGGGSLKLWPWLSGSDVLLGIKGGNITCHFLWRLVSSGTMLIIVLL